MRLQALFLQKYKIKSNEKDEIKINDELPTLGIPIYFASLVENWMQRSGIIVMAYSLNNKSNKHRIVHSLISMDYILWGISLNLILLLKVLISTAWVHGRSLSICFFFFL